MQAKYCTWTVLFIALVASGDLATAQMSPGVGPSHSAPVTPNYGKLPLTFESNQGQVGPQAKFFARGPGYSVFLTSGGMVLSLRPATGAKSLTRARATPVQSAARPPLQTLARHALRARSS